LGAKAEEFIGLVKAAGWSQAEAARRLHITPGAISQIFSGRTQPHPGTLNLLKYILATEKPEVLKAFERARVGGLAPWESQLLEALRGLRPAHREALLVAFQEMIRAMQARQRRRGD